MTIYDLNINLKTISYLDLQLLIGCTCMIKNTSLFGIICGFNIYANSLWADVYIEQGKNIKVLADEILLKRDIKEVNNGR